MAQTIQTAQAGARRIFVRFGRRSDGHNPAGGMDWRSDGRRGSWYGCEVSSRGL